MIRSKYVLIGAVAAAFIPIVAIVISIVRAPEQNTAVQDSDALFVEEVTEFGVAESGEDEETTDFKSKILQKLAETDTDSEEDLVTTEDEVSPTVLLGPARILGDGMASNVPQNGRVFVCEDAEAFSEVTEGREWIVDGVWYPEEKTSIEGGAKWDSVFSYQIVEGARLLRGNGLPKHPTGVFTNSILPQSFTVQLPKDPWIAGSPLCLSEGMVGMSLSGAPLYRALDGQGQDIAAREVFDSCEGHPDENGQYHYLRESACVFEQVFEGAVSTLLGYALDGFGIFSSTEGAREITNDDLDECHGHEHVIPWDGELRSMYHYHMTEEFPYTLGCFMGAPASVSGEVATETPAVN